MQIHLHRVNDDFNFHAVNQDGNSISIDASSNIGGSNKGMRPMQLLLAALGGCSGIDVASILRKQKQIVVFFEIKINGEREEIVSQDYSLFKTIHVHFILKGNLNKLKVEKAVKLSMEKYCSVAKILEPTAKITYTITLN